MGHGSGLVVSVLAVYSDDTSSNPAGYLNFLYERMKINEKEAGVGPSLKGLLNITNTCLNFAYASRDQTMERPNH